MIDNTIVLSFYDTDIFTILINLNYFNLDWNFSIDNFRINNNNYQSKNIFVSKDFNNNSRKITLSDTIYGLPDRSNYRNKDFGISLKDVVLADKEMIRNIKNDPRLIEEMARYGIDIEELENKIEPQSSYIWLGYSWLTFNNQNTKGFTYGAHYNSIQYNTSYSRSIIDNLDFSSLSVIRSDEFSKLEYSTSESYDPARKYTIDKYNLDLLPYFYNLRYEFNKFKLNSNELGLIILILIGIIIIMDYQQLEDLDLITFHIIMVILLKS